MNRTNAHTIDVNSSTIKIAIDMHLRSYSVVRQIGHQAPQPAQRFTPGAFFQWLEKQIAQADEAAVAICYEAGCFGYEPARRMQKMGAQVYVIAPQDWDEQQKKQVNDKFDARVMCRRLNDYLCGERHALSVVRIPSPEEEAQRAQARQREQLRRELRRIQAMGRSLLLAREMPVIGRWWTGKKWSQIQQQMPAWVLTQLSAWKEILELIERRAKVIEAELEKAAPQQLPMGEGKLSHELFSREMIDPRRFKNPRQVGNYFGLCPSESSSGESRRLGSITKHGNPRLRKLMVEMAWRIVLYQPQYRAVKKWGALVRDKGHSSCARKKAIIALARRLAVDLWRIATGRITAQELGLTMTTA
jgi:transposase